ncbi:hypothetical protein [Methanosarcina sp. KYL-1]|nr:hypothetical protein [Methanosarcina sp. KYL-1]
MGLQRLPQGTETVQPSENELAMTRYQGRHVAEIAKKLSRN